MNVRIEKIGDALGIVLLREMLDACDFGGEATVIVRDKTLVASPRSSHAREAWAEALSAISQAELDRDFVDLGPFREPPHQWDSSHWQWPDTTADEKV